MRATRHPLDQALRVRRLHRLWMSLQVVLGAGPVFGLVNAVQPMVTDGYGRDAIREFLPDWLARHYGAALAASLACFAASELLRRRYHARHRDEIDL